MGFSSCQHAVSATNTTHHSILYCSHSVGWVFTGVRVGPIIAVLEASPITGYIYNILQYTVGMCVGGLFVCRIRGGIYIMYFLLCRGGPNWYI